MEQYKFSNSDIDLSCERVGKFLTKAGVDRRETIRAKFTFEEILLKYQDKFGEGAGFKVKLVKRLSSIKVEIIVEGSAYDVLDMERDEDDVIQDMLASIGLAPTWSYKSGKNYVVFILKKKRIRCH